MGLINKVKVFMKTRNKRVVLLSTLPIFRILPDKTYLKILYKLRLKKNINFNAPKTFNQKLQWLKLYNRKDIYTTMVDKYEVKNYIKEKIGEKYIIPTIGVWDRFEDIDFDSLPNQFVFKCTHDSGGLIICRDKEKLNLSAARAKICKSLKKNYFWLGREWPYKNVKPRIIAEKYISNTDIAQENNSLIVYKVLCFNGEPKIIQVIQNDKCKNESIDYFDTNWNLLKLKQNYPNSNIHLTKPENFKEMLALSAELSKEIPFLRVDWYVSGGKLLFSEFTFYSDSGTAAFEPSEWDDIMGEWIKLPN